MTLYGAFVSTPTTVFPTRNSHFAGVPSVSLASALKTMLVGPNVWKLLVGEVIETRGGALVAAVAGSEIVITADDGVPNTYAGSARMLTSTVSTPSVNVSRIGLITNSAVRLPARK